MLQVHPSMTYKCRIEFGPVPGDPGDPRRGLFIENNDQKGLIRHPFPLAGNSVPGGPLEAETGIIHRVPEMNLSRINYRLRRAATA